MSKQTFSVSIPPDARYLTAVRSFLKSVLGDLFGQETEMVILAVDESCSNFLKHGCDRLASSCLRVETTLGEESACFRIDSFCREEDLPNIRPRELQKIRPGGLGTHFVQRIMDRVEFEPDSGQPGRMTLILEKRIPQKA